MYKANELINFQKKDSLNIFQMYIENGNKANFWIQRNSWYNYVGHVVSIGGDDSGSLDDWAGKYPYYSSACSCVETEFYLISSDSKGGYLKRVKPDSPIEINGNFPLFNLSCPATFAYSRIFHPQSPIRVLNLNGEFKLVSID